MMAVMEAPPSSGEPETGVEVATPVGLHTERRLHTGRRRNEAARQAILDAAFRLLRSADGRDLTIDAIASAAGVGKQTIYRWWPSKGAVVAAALADRARDTARVPDSGTLRDDLVRFLVDTFAGAADRSAAGMLRRIMAAAQDDPHLAEAVAGFTAQRRRELRSLLERGQARGELPGTADLDMLTDLAYGFLWYRLLVGHASLDASAAESLAGHLIAAGVQQQSSPPP
jgi:AcrR family transcriptional regulator